MEVLEGGFIVASRVVESICVSGVQIDQCRNAVGITCSDGTKFFPSDGVANQHGLCDLELIQHGQNVVSQPFRSVTSLGVRGPAESASRNGVDVMLVRELRGKIVPNMRGVPETGEEDNRTSRAAPVQHFELDTLVYGDHFSVVR